jgi:hypothetical protein
LRALNLGSADDAPQTTARDPGRRHARRHGRHGTCRLARPTHHADRALGRGGGTDATARIIGSLLEKELGQPVTVVNRTGGSGVVGHQAIARPRPTATPSG